MKLSINRNQAGIGLPIIILIVAVIAVAAGAYFFINKDKDDTANSNDPAQAALASECTRAMNDKDLCRFAASGINLDRNVVYTMTVSGGGADGVTTMRIDGDRNMHMTNTTAGETAETITLNGAYYIRSGGEEWMKMPMAQDALPEDEGLAAPDFDFDAPNVDEVYVKEGKEACGNLTCFKYTWKGSDDLEGTYTFWFDDKEYKLRRFTTTSSDGTMEAVISYENVTISEPSPIREFSL